MIHAWSHGMIIYIQKISHCFFNMCVINFYASMIEAGMKVILPNFDNLFKGELIPGRRLRISQGDVHNLGHGKM